MIRLHTTARPPSLPRRRAAGLTLTELMVVVATAGVTLASTAPGFQQARERRHVEGLAAQLETDIHHTRGLAVAQNRNLRIEFLADAHGSCYVVHSGSAGDCTCTAQGAQCAPGVQAHRSEHVPAERGVVLSANVRSMVFDAEKGTVTPTGTLRVQGASGQAIHQVVNIMGRVRSCAAGGEVLGLRPC